MGFSLFKTGDELYDIGVDAVKRGDWNGARDKFSDAIRKGTAKAKMAELMIAIIDLKGRRGSVEAYEKVINALESCGQQQFVFGLTDIVSDQLGTECGLLIEEIKANSLPDSDYENKSAALNNVAGMFSSQLGDTPMKINEMFDGTTGYTGTREANILQALAYEILGRGVVMENPKQAAEYMQTGATFRKMVGDSGQDDMKLAEQYSRSAKCWFCGRPMSGEGVHFVTMKSSVTPVFRPEIDKDIIRTAPTDFRSVYVCMPCYSAIFNESNDIAQEYYDRGMAELRAAEARLQAQIDAVRSSVALVNR